MDSDSKTQRQKAEFFCTVNDFWLPVDKFDWEVPTRTLLLDKHAVALDPVHMPTGERPHRCWARVLNAEMEVENLKKDYPVALGMKFNELQSTLN